MYWTPAVYQASCQVWGNAMGSKTVLGMTAEVVMFIIHQEFVLLPTPYCSFPQWLGPLEDICSRPAFPEPPPGNEEQTPPILPSCVGRLLWGGGDETQNRLWKAFCWWIVRNRHYILFWISPKADLETGCQVQIVYLGSDLRKYQ